MPLVVSRRDDTHDRTIQMTVRLAEPNLAGGLGHEHSDVSDSQSVRGTLKLYKCFVGTHQEGDIDLHSV
jgi:hypothetical protein